MSTNVVDNVRFKMHCSELILHTLQLVEKLLIAAVADADVTVRHSIFSSLHGNRGFDDFLAQADSLSAVFAALNDEVCVTYGDITLIKFFCFCVFCG